MSEAPSTEAPSTGTLGVSVVIATRSRVPLLRECLDLLLPQLRDGDEIVVVDDDPAGSAQAALVNIDPRVRVLSSGGSGPAGARNTGVRATRGDIVAFTDDDVLPAATWLEALRDGLASRSDASGVEGPIVSDPFDMVFVHSVESHGPGAYYTANVAYRGRDLREELFDESFAFPYGEDLDLGFRMLRRGPVLYDERMRVRHRPRPLPLREFWHRGRFVENDWVLYRRYPDFAPPRFSLRWKPASRRLIEWVKMLRDIMLGRRPDTGHARAAVFARAFVGGAFEVTRAVVVTFTRWSADPGDSGGARPRAEAGPPPAVP
jgi:glycosyltransferase involved in cell wall biosynthesis